MPAVHPARLKAEIEELAGSLNDPVRLSRQVVSLLQFYAEYTRRPGASTGVDDAPWVLHVPDPIVREIERALVGSLGKDPTLAQGHCYALWSTGYRETQQITAALLSAQSQAWVADWVEEHARGCRDRPVLGNLASRGLRGWRAADMGGFLERVEAWLNSEEIRMQTFALLALAEVPSEEGDWLPAVFDILEGYHWKARGETEKALISLVQVLASASNRETAGFLLTMLGERPESTAPFLSAVKPYFSARHQQLFELAVDDSIER